jgi:hypothetical protein
MNWKLWAGVAAIVVFFLLWSRRAPYTGATASGWGGNWTGNLPTLFNPNVIVGTFSNGRPIYGPSSAAGAARGAAQSYGELP